MKAVISVHHDEIVARSRVLFAPQAIEHVSGESNNEHRAGGIQVGDHALDLRVGRHCVRVERADLVPTGNEAVNGIIQ